MKQMTKKSHSKLVEENIGLVINQAKKVHRSNKYADFDELVQIGLVCLWKIVKGTNYSPDKGAFSTYASKVIYRAMIKYVNKEAKVTNYTQIADQYMIVGQHFCLWEYLPMDMTLEDVAILTMRYEGYNLEEIGERFGHSREWAGKKINKIYKRIREANESTQETKNTSR